jgi:PP-loop superfamily ATP-utilizing enzyme
MGFRQVRVRDFGSHARVEVEVDELAELSRLSVDVETSLVGLGFESWAPSAYAGYGAGDSPNGAR